MFLDHSDWLLCDHTNCSHISNREFVSCQTILESSLIITVITVIFHFIMNRVYGFSNYSAHTDHSHISLLHEFKVHGFSNYTFL